MTTANEVTATNEIDISDLSLYLSFLKYQDKTTGMSNYMAHRRVNPIEGATDEPIVSGDTKELALAIANAMSSVRDFGNTNRMEWLFKGSAHMDEELQESVSFFFYANKNNVLKAINNVMATKGAEPQSLAYFLRGIAIGFGSATDEKLIDEFEVLKQSHRLPSSTIVNLYSGVSLYGIMIAQMLYQIMYYAEVKHHSNFFG